MIVCHGETRFYMYYYLYNDTTVHTISRRSWNGQPCARVLGLYNVHSL